MDEIWGNTGIKLIVVQEICLLAKKYNAEKVVLFGSRARGDYRRVSDIDLGFTGEIFADLRWMWMRRLVIRLLIQMNVNAPSLRREFQCVRQQIQQHLV